MENKKIVVFVFVLSGTLTLLRAAQSEPTQLSAQAIARNLLAQVIPPQEVAAGPIKIKRSLNELSPDGTLKIIVTPDKALNKTIKILDVETDKLLLSLEGDSAAFSPDGSKIIFDYWVPQDKQGIYFIQITKMWDMNSIYQKIIADYFNNNTLPLRQQALLVTLDGISKQKNGQPITKSDLMKNFKLDTSVIFTGIPNGVQNALKNYYRLTADIIEIPPHREHAVFE